MNEKMAVRKFAGIIGVGMMSVCLAAGCGGKGAVPSSGAGKADSVNTADAQEEEGAAESESAAGEDAKAGVGYVFESNGVELAADMDMSELADKLGEPANYYEEPSCAAQGIAKIYTYSGFEVETYPDGEKDLIARITLKDDSVSTPEGLDLSMTEDDILAAYGADCEETETSMVYEKDGKKLRFILDGEDIASIEYHSPVLN